MADITIGYNAKKAIDVMEDVNKAYNKLGDKISSGWKDVRKSIKDNWVGEDANNFQVKFCERLNSLYLNALQLTTTCNNNITQLVNDWYAFQRTNTVDGSSGEGSLSIEAPTAKDKSPVAEADPENLSQNTDRGLKDASSATTIKSAVAGYVEEIKAETTTLFADVDVSKAFLGEQAAGIKSYVEAVGAAMGQVVIAVKDLNDALDNLAGQNYTGTVESFSQSMSSAASQVDSSLDGLSSSRWTS